MPNDSASLGKASLWTSVIGVVLPVCLVILIATFLQPPKEQERLESERLRQRAETLCGVLFVILELVALGCGIAARRTATAKAGLTISVILLLLCSYVLWEWFRPRYGGIPLNAPQVAPDGPQQPESQKAKGQPHQGEK